MASEIGICNSALRKIGAAAITSLTEGSNNANYCNEQYEKLRDDLLRSHSWNFATKRVELGRLSSTPAYGFDNEFQQPADCLRVVSVSADESGVSSPEYKIEGRMIRCNETQLFLRYVARITDPNQMPPDFREALAAVMARDAAIPIAQSNTLREQMEREAQRRVAQAKSADALEDYPERMPESSWTQVRG